MSDLIERQAAIDVLMSLTIYKSKREIVQAANKDENSWIGGVAECIDEIEDLPSALPEKHGRLIDSDALIADIRKNSASYFADDFAHEWVDRQPIIVEAEGE